MYDSLKASGELPEETLAHFDTDGAEDLLYELRFLGVEKRVEPARYIVANNLDVKVLRGSHRAPIWVPLGLVRVRV